MAVLDEKQMTEYIEFLKSNDRDATKKYLLDNVPKGIVIYKYCRGLVRDLNTMQQKNIWLSNASSFNDPFDCAYLVNKRSKEVYPEDESENALKEYLEQQEADRDSKIKTNSSFVACFSEICNSSAMWGYYADNHMGLCIGYDLVELIEKFNIMPVIYSNEVPVIGMENGVPNMTSVMTKSLEWQHEREWRIFQYDESKQGKNGILIGEILPKEIIIGCREKETASRNRAYREQKISSELLYADVADIISWGRQVKNERYVKIYDYVMNHSAYELKKREWRNIYV